ncbi:hypothetical protein H072_11079 [Dactylellina haptotyla CBS 200.50]|uniref:T6SS Phospholipase effector Tle1-like catalytic domain-containing protein n=1 Tax=Dactylellina haptotyla (strain CBS 200.50) TaxID=1284197 RepID=S7ZXP6_DACHA|nr:hypothetical protein H072_11079 [Dactylellina haptotyla CBS 200.50]
MAIEDSTQTDDYVEEEYVQENSGPRTWAKRIIICCDGTGQSAVSGKKSSPSNIARLARSVWPSVPDQNDPNKEWQQIVWYDSGVGTTSDKIGQAIESAVGHGLEGNVIEAYNFIALNYNPGDQILCFGFSRGAYTARAIAGLISDIGICGREYLHEFPNLWAVYTDKKRRKAGERFCGSQAYFDFIDGELADVRLQPEAELEEYTGYNFYELNWKSKPHFWMEDPSRFLYASRKVEVVGVFDTVGSLGVPAIRGYHPFGIGTSLHNVELNPNIRRAFHAIALDEHREAFSPTLYSVPTAEAEARKKKPTEQDLENQMQIVEDLRKEWFSIVPSLKASPQEKGEVRKRYIDARKELLEMEENILEPSELKQVWFPGVHINVGGGSNATLASKGNLEETANIVFAWMLDHISNHLGIDQLRILADNDKVKELITEHNNQVKLVEMTKKLDAEAAKKESWAQATWRFGKYISSVVAAPLATPVDTRILPAPGWALGDYLESYTLLYKANGSKWRTPGDYNTSNDTQTNEEIHPTVGYRLLKLGDKYKPLEDRVHRQKNKDGSGWEYVLNGITLPEYKLNPPPETVYGSWCYERLAITQDAKEYVREMDKAYGYPGWELDCMVPSYNRVYGDAAVL